MSDNALINPVTHSITLPGIGLNELAGRIRARDEQRLIGARTYWLETGRDLLDAKALIGHGNFTSWCKELGYSLRKAEKLMQAAEMFGCLSESENFSNLPAASVAYALSAPRLSPSIRDEFLPRALNGERIGPQLRQAIKVHAQAAKGELRRAGDEHIWDGQSDEAAHARTLSNDQMASAEVQDEQLAARSAALSLIVEQLGDKIADFLTLVAKAGAGEIFSFAGERELREAASESAGNPIATANDLGVNEAIAEDRPLTRTSSAVTGAEKSCTKHSASSSFAEHTGAVSDRATTTNEPSATAKFRPADFGSELRRSVLGQHTPRSNVSSDQIPALPSMPLSTVTGPAARRS